jgi:hypothetical protein
MRPRRRPPVMRNVFFTASGSVAGTLAAVDLEDGASDDRGVLTINHRVGEDRPLLSKAKTARSVKPCVRRKSTTYIQRVLGVAYHQRTVRSIAWNSDS